MEITWSFNKKTSPVQNEQEEGQEGQERTVIVIIDDKPDELEAARIAVTAAGYKIRSIFASPLAKEEIWAALAQQNVVGVITDLMFPLSKGSGLQPNGLLVAVHAISLGLPVVICTDDEGDHHAGPCGAVRDGYYNGWTKNPAFGFEEGKDWGRAMSDLLLRMKK